MNQGRETILTNIRAALGHAERSADDIAEEASSLVAEAARFQPKFADQSNLERFIAKATSERVTATVSQVENFGDVPSTVAAYLERNGLPNRIVVQPRPALTTLDWSKLDVHDKPLADETLVVSIADLAIAETGSVVFLSGHDAPTLLTFLPLHHIVVVNAALIHSHLEDVFTFVGHGQKRQPRNLCIVTGTSGTADIEGKNIRGAHGPKFMHIVIVNSS